MKIRFLGHSCFELQGASGKIIIDPFLTGNPQAAATVDQIEDLDAILVTHGHRDHIGDALELAKRTNALIIGTYELATYCRNLGARVHELHIGGKYKFPFGTVKLTPALHGSGIPGDGPSMLYGGPACGFLVELDGQWVYHAGDTGLFRDMELIGTLNELAAAMLPIGDNYVMGPEDAVLAAKWLKAKRVIPMHYNTFPVIEQDPERFIDALKRECPQSQGVLLKPGDRLEL